MGIRIVAIAVLFVAALGVVVPLTPTSAAVATGYRVVPNDVPTLVSHGRATVIGHVAPSRNLRIVIALRIRDWAALDRAIMRASSLGSATYGHYLSQAQANRLFNPTTSEQRSVGGWLRSEGLRIRQTFPNHLLVDATGAAQTIERAFRVSILNYRGRLYANRPTDFFAPSRAPSVPARLAGIIQTVLGLDNAARAFPEKSDPSWPSVRLTPRRIWSVRDVLMAGGLPERVQCPQQ